MLALWYSSLSLCLQSWHPIWALTLILVALLLLLPAPVLGKLMWDTWHRLCIPVFSLVQPSCYNNLGSEPVDRFSLLFCG